MRWVFRLHHHIADVVAKCDLSSRSALYHNVLVSGGTTCFDGFDGRLECELKALLATDVAQAAADTCRVRAEQEMRETEKETERRGNRKDMARPCFGGGGGGGGRHPSKFLDDAMKVCCNRHR